MCSLCKVCKFCAIRSLLPPGAITKLKISALHLRRDPNCRLLVKGNVRKELRKVNIAGVFLVSFTECECISGPEIAFGIAMTTPVLIPPFRAWHFACQHGLLTSLSRCQPPRTSSDVIRRLSSSAGPEHNFRTCPKSRKQGKMIEYFWGCADFMLKNVTRCLNFAILAF